MNNQKQLQLPFKPSKETTVERCRHLLSGELGRVVRPASELEFDYEKASRIAGRYTPPKSRSQ